MSRKIIQTFIRGDVISREIAEVDELGRQVGAIAIVEATVATALAAELAKGDEDCLAAQDVVIEAAKDAKRDNPDAVVVLVADLKASKP